MFLTGASFSLGPARSPSSPSHPLHQSTPAGLTCLTASTLSTDRIADGVYLPRHASRADPRAIPSLVESAGWAGAIPSGPGHPDRLWRTSRQTRGNHARAATSPPLPPFVLTLRGLTGCPIRPSRGPCRTHRTTEEGGRGQHNTQPCRGPVQAPSSRTRPVAELPCPRRRSLS